MIDEKDLIRIEKASIKLEDYIINITGCKNIVKYITENSRLFMRYCYGYNRNEFGNKLFFPWEIEDIIDSINKRNSPKNKKTKSKKINTDKNVKKTKIAKRKTKTERKKYKTGGPGFLFKKNKGQKEKKQIK